MDGGQARQLFPALTQLPARACDAVHGVGVHARASGPHARQRGALPGAARCRAGAGPTPAHALGARGEGGAGRLRRSPASPCRSWDRRTTRPSFAGRRPWPSGSSRRRPACCATGSRARMQAGLLMLESDGQGLGRAKLWPCCPASEPAWAGWAAAHAARLRRPSWGPSSAPLLPMPLTSCARLPTRGQQHARARTCRRPCEPPIAGSHQPACGRGARTLLAASGLACGQAYRAARTLPDARPSCQQAPLPGVMRRCPLPRGQSCASRACRCRPRCCRPWPCPPSHAESPGISWRGDSERRLCT